MKKRKTRSDSIVWKAHKALKIAVAKTIEDHRRTGDPIVVWRHGKIVRIPAQKIPKRGFKNAG